MSVLFLKHVKVVLCMGSILHWSGQCFTVQVTQKFGRPKASMYVFNIGPLFRRTNIDLVRFLHVYCPNYAIITKRWQKEEIFNTLLNK